MAEFEDKLNALLSDPNSMAQIMQLAQSLNGGASAPPPQPGPVQNGYPPQGGYPPPSGQPQGGYQSPPQSGFPPPGNFQAPQGLPQGPPQGGNPLASLLGGIDPGTIARLMPLVQELGNPQNNNNRALLYALRPYLKPERQMKIERALQLARIVHIGKKFIAGWEAGGMYNRYIRNDNGSYSRIPEEDPRSGFGSPPPPSGSGNGPGGFGGPAPGPGGHPPPNGPPPPPPGVRCPR